MALLASRGNLRFLQCVAVAASLLVAALPGIAAPSCNVSVRALVGSWKSEGGPFEQMELAREDGQSVFRSWLHDRLDVIGGNWQLTGCALRISAGQRYPVQWELEVGTVTKTRLTVRERGERRFATYRRIP